MNKSTQGKGKKKYVPERRKNVCTSVMWEKLGASEETKGDNVVGTQSSIK